MNPHKHPLWGLFTRRKLLGISQAAMAAQLGVTAVTYSRWENGTRRAYFDQVITMASILGCTTDDLRNDPSDDEQVALMRRNIHSREAQRLGMTVEQYEHSKALMQPQAQSAPTSSGRSAKRIVSNVEDEAERARILAEYHAVHDKPAANPDDIDDLLKEWPLSDDEA